MWVTNITLHAPHALYLSLLSHPTSQITLLSSGCFNSPLFQHFFSIFAFLFCLLLLGNLQPPAQLAVFSCKKNHTGGNL